MAYRLDDGNWANQELLEQFLESSGKGPQEAWYLARWSAGEPRSGGLIVRLFCPLGESQGEIFRSLTGDLRAKLSNGLVLACHERGWPLPRFTIEPLHQEIDESWGYQLSLGPFQTEPFVLYPTKILAVGEEAALSSLLGLEAIDPVFGLPAKWVTHSQSERAAHNGSLLFEAAEVVMGHSINFLSSHMEHALGLWELNRWLSNSLPFQGARACQPLQEDAPFLLKLVKELVGEGLHLPPPERVCEYLQMARGESEKAEEISVLVRREVVNDNIGDWLDEEGFLNAVEWRGPEELNAGDHHRMLERLCRTIEQVHSTVMSGRPVLMVNVEARRELAESLKSLFPDLPVLAWSDLKDLSNIRTVASVNAKLSVDPPAFPTAFFQN